jgi:transposase
MRFDLSDEEWVVIEPLLPKGGRGPKRVDDRRIVNGIFYIPRTGAPWRDLPERYGPRTTVYNRYARWARRGSLQNAHHRRALLPHHERHAKARNTLRKTQPQLPRHDPRLRHKTIDRLSPHPKRCLV